VRLLHAVAILPSEGHNLPPDTRKWLKKNKARLVPQLERAHAAGCVPILYRARVDVPDAATRRILCGTPEGLELFAAQLKSGTVGGIIDGHRDPPLIVKTIAEILLVEGE
jgi:hypothetical protein